MKTFIKNWDFKKHIIAETMFYASLAMVGNAFFKKPEKKGALDNCSLVACKNMPKKQKIFNGSLAGLYILDLTAGYCLLKALKKITKSTKS